LHAARGAGCRTEDLQRRLYASNPSDEEKQKILKDLKEIERISPYHWVEFLIGKWYGKGWGGEENRKQALVWYTKAKNSENIGAMVNLAIYYEDGDLGLTQSSTKAIELYAFAADKGDAMARYNLGWTYKDGNGVEIDFIRCVESWKQSAKQGFVDAQHRLSRLYRDGSKDGPPMTIPINDQLAFRWCLAAAKKGHADCMNDIGIHYENGTGGLDQNLGTAFEWFMKSAVEGNQHGQYNVGSYYEKGKGTTTRDFAQALHWYQKSAEQELPRAQFSVGFFFEHGRGGIPIDLEQALHWYQKAAAQENTRAMEAVARLSST